jgi:outer membrane protein assembly factor BamB
MNCCPTLRRWLAALATVAVFGAVLAAVIWSGRAGSPEVARADEKAAAERGWPMFGGTLQRNMVNTTEKNMPMKWNVKTGEGIKWVAELGSKAYGGPVVAGGKIFIGTNNDRPRDKNVKGDKGVLMCFDEATGKFLWQKVYDKLESGRVNDWPHEGICSSPFVEGNRLYFVNNRCQVVCCDLDGKDVWTLDMMKELGVFPHNLATCSPLAVNNTLFIITSNGVDLDHLNIPKPEAPSFIAVDKKTGSVLWKNNDTTVNLLKPGANLKDLANKGKVLMHGQWSNPVYTEVEGKPEILFPGGDGWIYAFAPEKGEVLWRFDCNPKTSFYALGGKGTRSDFVATPVIHDNRLYIGVGQDPEHDYGVGHFWCIDVAKATKLGGDVSPRDDNFDPKAAVNEKSALAWHYGGFITPAPSSGREYRFGRTMSTASVHDGLCYIAEQEGILHCLDALTGEEYWQHDMNADCWSSPYSVDGKVYMGNDHNRLLIFEHGKKEKKIAEIDMRGKVRATPTAADGVLFVMTENKLYAIGK